MDRARPNAALNSSTLPQASTRGSAFDSRRPYINDVSPLSPVLVTMDISKLYGRFCELRKLSELIQTPYKLTDRRLRLSLFHHWRANPLAFFDYLKLAMFLD